MGTKITIWKQGAHYPELGKKIIEFDHPISPGPSDDRVNIKGFEVIPDENGDFITGTTEGTYSADELDAVHTFGVIRYIIKMYETYLEQPLRWSWEKVGDSLPLNVYIRKNGINARYLKTARCIQLDYFGPYNNWSYYCRSVDIIAHETGHAILDGLKPDWEKGKIETRGLAEAFCDLTAMYMVTSQMDLCEIVLHENQGDFKKDSILSLFGFGFGAEGNQKAPIRNAINSVKFKDDYEFSYMYAKVLTGCLYDILVSLLEQKTTSSITAIELYENAKIWQRGIIKTYISCKSDNSTLKEFGEHLIEFLHEHEEIIIQHFINRGIF